MQVEEPQLGRSAEFLLRGFDRHVCEFPPLKADDSNLPQDFICVFTIKIGAVVFFICATDPTVIYMRRSRPRGCQQEGGQRDDAKPQKGIKEEK